jgi:hypothetical protein
MTQSGAMNKFSRAATVIAIVMVGVALVGSIMIPTAWIYDTLALQIAFGSERASREHITVEKITKPSTVTFSNGEQVDVGMKPAVFASVFRVVVTIPLMLGYMFLVKRCGPKWIQWNSPRALGISEPS